MARRFVVLIALCLFVAPAAATKLVVGTKPSPPFAMKAADGSWTGISIELWRELARQLGADYEIREYDLPGLLAAVEHHDIDITVASLTVTAEREQKLDFTHPIYSTGLAIATIPGGKGGPLAVLRGLFTWDLAKLLGALLALLSVIGVIVWLLEHRRNDQFPRRAGPGIAAGVWWSAVTMTTVGYGDKSPVTLPGRILGIAWMFAAIIIISLFTASVTTTLTVDRLESSIKGPEDLVPVRVGTLAKSTSAAYLDRHHIAYSSVTSVLDGEQRVARGELDALVYDAPLLQYTARHDLGGAVIVLPAIFDHQDYAFALPDGSALREPLNRLLLGELGSERWTELLDRYLGK